MCYRIIFLIYLRKIWNNMNQNQTDKRRNNLYFFIAVFAIILGFQWYNQPSAEQLEKMRATRDSILAVQQQEAELAKLQEAEKNKPLDLSSLDSATRASIEGEYGVFASALSAPETVVSLENNLIKVDFTTKGGFVKCATLKEYDSYKGGNVKLNVDSFSKFDIVLPTTTKSDIHTAKMNFKVKSQDANSVVLALTTTTGESLDFVYTLPEDEYMLGFKIVSNGLDKYMKSSKSLGIEWAQEIYQKEKGRDFENRYCTVYYKEYEDDVNYLSETSADNKTFDEDEPLKWVAFKDQFFSSFLIADDKFALANLESSLPSNEEVFLKKFKSTLALPFATDKANSEASMHMYFGPNKYSILYDYDDKLNADVDMNRVLTLGWGIFRWVNQCLVIPMFNFFGSFLTNYGLIILLMTIVIKMLIFPMTYKSYLSSAKMRVLKPQIDEINKRIPEDKPMERQQEMMKLYSSAGVSPMGGCLPMLLQMPFLFAMFSFFPASIELRGQSFLWADDLSSYDSIVSWNYDLPFIGDHISLFCLLMTVTNVIYSYWNMKLTDNGMQQGQQGVMKIMMLAMPVVFFFVFNGYASGLSYYYFISLLITIIQTYVIRKTINEEELLEKLQQNQRKPQSKSSWMSRLEEMQRIAEEQRKNAQK